MKGCPGPGATGASTLLPMLTLSCFLQPKTPQRPQILISITALVRVSGLFSILENNLGFPHWKASLLPRAQWSKQTKKKQETVLQQHSQALWRMEVFLQLSGGSETSLVLATLVVCVFLVVSSPRVTQSTQGRRYILASGGEARLKAVIQQH